VHSGFEIYYSFGVNEKNILDTKNNLYIKDMICEPSKNITLYMSAYDMTRIYDSIIQNNLFNIKDNFTNNCSPTGCQEISPLSTATLKIASGDKIKTIKWRANYIDKNDPELIRFQNVTDTIQNIISQKEKDMAIEKPKCGYM